MHLHQAPVRRLPAVGNPLAEGGDLLIRQGVQALIGDLLGEPRQAYGGGELMVAQDGKHIGPRTHIPQNFDTVRPPVDDIPQHVELVAGAKLDLPQHGPVFVITSVDI